MDRQTINRRLDGKIINGRVLTENEEQSIVAYVKNKNRALQGVNRSDLTKLIIDVLKIRSYANKGMKGGRKYVALSKNAKEALTKKK